MITIKIEDLKKTTGVGFGTSGIRDLATKLTSEVVYTYTTAFLEYLRSCGELSTKVALAGDLRESTDRIMKDVAKACMDAGVEVVNCGKIPTPAVAYYGLINSMPSIMVTGSHIPGDRNGIKFNLANREILKQDEEAISKMEVTIDENLVDRSYDLPSEITDGKNLYIKRYTDFFDNDLLAGKKIGLYGHSAVGRDIYEIVLKGLGALVVKLDYSEIFVPIDTETADETLQQKGKTWQKEYQLDLMMSTDGDGDRPLLSDENGKWLKSEILPVLTSKFLKIENVATTLTSNTLMEKTGWFKKTCRTKVGSPYVLEAINKFIEEGGTRVAAYEANGGFLLGTAIDNLRELPTRDALMPILGTIALAKESNKTIDQIVSELPQRFTYSLSIKGIPTELSLDVIERWEEYRGDIETEFGKIREVDKLDGLRLLFENGDIVHFRPSKNSPEFRNYCESETHERAKMLAKKAINLIEKWTKNC